MLETLQILAALSTCIFAGAAIYINIAEHPARMGCETVIAATVWAPSYQRAYVMQASLALTGLVSGSLAWFVGGGMGWLIGALFIGAVIPVTFIVIMPTNRRLLESGRDLASAETRDLLVRWGQLHAIRSVLSLIASVVYLRLLHGA